MAELVPSALCPGMQQRGEAWGPGSGVTNPIPVPSTPVPGLCTGNTQGDAVPMPGLRTGSTSRSESRQCRGIVGEEPGSTPGAGLRWSGSTPGDWYSGLWSGCRGSGEWARGVSREGSNHVGNLACCPGFSRGPGFLCLYRGLIPMSLG